MLKKLLILLSIINFSFYSYSQSNAQLLNGYKYVYVHDLQYQGGGTDIYGLAMNTRSFLSSMGFSVVTDLEKFNGNPCEVLVVSVNNSSRSKVFFESRNCKNEIVYKTTGHAANWVNNYQDNFNRSLDIIFKKLSRLSYFYNVNLTPKLDIFVPKYEGDLFDYNDEESIRQYFDANKSDAIEGIWNYVDNSGAGKYKFFIIKNGYNYNVHILESEGWWNAGELKAELEPAAVNTLLTVNWTMSDKQTKIETVGKVEGGVFSFTINESEAVLYKVYPKLESKNSISTINNTNGWSGNGSGIIISKSGHIVTNNHVIEGASEIEVEFIQGGEVKKYNAEIIQVDKVNDLAIIKIFDINFNGVSPLPYNFKSRSSDVGTKVYAYGYPLALTLMGKEIKITDGIISSKSGLDGDITTYQISATIQPGNSGGPLFDDKGNLIGINSSGLARLGSETTGYSIKSNYVLNLIDVLPNSIDLPNSNKLESLPLTEQIKEIAKFVVLVKVK